MHARTVDLWLGDTSPCVGGVSGSKFSMGSPVLDLASKPTHLTWNCDTPPLGGALSDHLLGLIYTSFPAAVSSASCQSLAL